MHAHVAAWPAGAVFAAGTAEPPADALLADVRYYTRRPTDVSALFAVCLSVCLSLRLSFASVHPSNSRYICICLSLLSMSRQPLVLSSLKVMTLVWVRAAAQDELRETVVERAYERTRLQ